MENLNTQIADLLNAVRCSDVREVKRLLAAHVSPTQCDADGQTALTVAAQCGSPQIMQLLCRAAANRSGPAQIFLCADANSAASSFDNFSLNQLEAPPERQSHFASSCETVAPMPTVSSLFSPTFASNGSFTERKFSDSQSTGITCEADGHKADGYKADGYKSIEQTYSSLERAVRRKDLQAVNILLRAGVSFRSPHWSDTPLLVIAAENGQEEILQALIHAGANVHIGCDQLPLHAAAANGHLAVVQRLLNSRAYIHAETDSGRTALMEAAANGHFLVTELLINKGANVNAICKGETALMMAAKGKHRAVYELLYPLVTPAGRVPFPDSTADALQLSLVSP